MLRAACTTAQLQGTCHHQAPRLHHQGVVQAPHHQCRPHQHAGGARTSTQQDGASSRRARVRICSSVSEPAVVPVSPAPAASTRGAPLSSSQHAEPPLQGQQQEQPLVDAASSSNEQEVKGLKELLQQQQALIDALQQDVQELRLLVVQTSSSSSSDSSSSRDSSQGVPASWQPQQQQVRTPPPPTQPPPPQQPQTQPQTPQQQRPGSSYQPMSIETFRALPDKIILVRHAESQGNVDATTYSNTPDYEVALSARGWEQAVACGTTLRALMEAEHGSAYKLFFMTSPYCRTRQTFVGIRQAFPDANFSGVQEEVQLREQDFGNFQNPAKIQADLAERNRFGRFYYRFPDGESGSDVYNRISIFEDHLIRDMRAGRFSANTSLCLVTHGLTMRVFLMRWFNWTVESFLQLFNPKNATPIIIEKIGEADYLKQISRLREKRQTLQVKHAYRLRGDSKMQLKMPTVTTDQMDLVHNYFE